MCNPISYQILSELSDYWTELTTYGGILKVNIGFQIKRLKMCENKIKLVVALGFISLAEHGDNKHNLSDTNPKKFDILLLFQMGGHSTKQDLIYFRHTFLREKRQQWWWYPRLNKIQLSVKKCRKKVKRRNAHRKPHHQKSILSVRLTTLEWVIRSRITFWVTRLFSK